MIKAPTTTEKEYLPILQYVMILSEKGIPVTLESVGNMMAIGAIDAKMGDDGKWYVAKHEMLTRIKACRRKLPPVESGYHSAQGFIYRLSELGIDRYDEDTVGYHIMIGKLEYKRDDVGRFVIPEHEFRKCVEKYGPRK